MLVAALERGVQDRASDFREQQVFEVDAEFENRLNIPIPVDSYGSSTTTTLYTAWTCTSISRTPNSDFVMSTYTYNFFSFRMQKYRNCHGHPNPYEGEGVISTHGNIGVILPRPWKRVVRQNARTPTGACLES